MNQHRNNRIQADQNYRLHDNFPICIYRVKRHSKQQRDGNYTRSRSTGDTGRDPAKKFSSSRRSTNKTHYVTPTVEKRGWGCLYCMRLVECSKFRSQAAIVCLVLSYGNSMRLLSIVVYSAASVTRARYEVTAFCTRELRTARCLQRSENVAIEMTCTIIVLLVIMLMVDVMIMMMMMTLTVR